MSTTDWINIRRDHATGVECVQAHFTGHAYDPHDHDEMLVGITQQGLQRFRCGRSVHTSTPGRAMLIEPGAVHDGHAPEDAGFTYAMLYLPQSWLATAARRLELPDLSRFGAFRHTLTADITLHHAIAQACRAVHQQEGRLACDQHLDQLLVALCGQLEHGPDILSASSGDPESERVRDALHAFMSRDIGMEELANLSGIDRFRLSRQFKRAFGLSPHAYLVRLRLRAARRLLANGQAPADVAGAVGFADQSHMGRWFQRAYRISPARYQRECANDQAFAQTF